MTMIMIMITIICFNKSLNAVAHKLRTPIQELTKRLKKHKTKFITSRLIYSLFLFSQCPANYTCMPNTGPNPISKYISYDNFGWALLTSLQLVTMDYWESIYNSVSSCLFGIYVFCEISFGIVCCRRHSKLQYTRCMGRLQHRIS